MKKIRLNKISYTSGNENTTKFLIFSQNSSPNSEEMNVQNPDITKLFLYFKKGILRTLT